MLISIAAEAVKDEEKWKKSQPSPKKLHDRTRAGDNQSINQSTDSRKNRIAKPIWHLRIVVSEQTTITYVLAVKESIKQAKFEFRTSML